MKKLIAMILALLLMVAAVWLMRELAAPAPAPPVATPVPGAATPDKSKAEPAPEMPAARAQSPAGSSEPAPNLVEAPIAKTVAERLHHADAEPVEDLMLLQDVLAIYRRALNGNPPGGENEEIVAGLIGRNTKRVAFVSPGHPAVNEEGKLLDRWGTPYFFHPISRHVMEIQSAGPDRMLWTEDDVLVEE